MANVIIYSNSDGTLGVISPADVSAVPSGRPYVIADESVLPSSRADRAAWRIDPTQLVNGAGAATVTVDAAAAATIARAGMVVSRFQAKAALAAASLLTSAETAVTTAGGTALLAWNEAIEFRRTSPTINTLATALWPTATQAERDASLDALFVAASQIEA